MVEMTSSFTPAWAHWHSPPVPVTFKDCDEYDVVVVRGKNFSESIV